MFNPKRIILARRRRRLTARSLAELAGITPDTVSRIENGLNRPDETTVARIARALQYPFEFFYAPDLEEIDTRAVSFRSFSKMSAKERDAAISSGALGLHLSAWVEERFSLPAVNLIDLSYEVSPIAAAYNLRQYWSLGERPIGNFLGLLEINGVRVFSLCENTASVNAFSFWRDSQAYIFLNCFKSAESSIFDAAHELGHLVMHQHGDPKESRALEKEANAFAAAFLMPERDLRARIPGFITIKSVLEAKKRWRVSAMALVHRLRNLDLISDWQYKSFCIELTRLGYRSSEPGGVERETSTVWRKVFEQLWRERTTKDDVARELGLPLDELEGLIWHLAFVSDRPEMSGKSLSVVR